MCWHLMSDVWRQNRDQTYADDRQLSFRDPSWKIPCAKAGEVNSRTLDIAYFIQKKVKYAT